LIIIIVIILELLVAAQAAMDARLCSHDTVYVFTL
jgi:hypothetical protein